MFSVDVFVKDKYWRKSASAGVESAYAFENDMNDEEISEMVRCYKQMPIRQCKVGKGVWSRMMHSLLKSVRKNALRKGVSDDLCLVSDVAYSVYCAKWMELTALTKEGRKFKGAAGTGLSDPMLLYIGQRDSSYNKAVSTVFGTERGAEMYFPMKKGTAADTKQNVYLGNLLEALRRTDQEYWTLLKRSLLDFSGTANDTMCCMVMSHYATHSHGYAFTFFDWAVMLRSDKLVKALSDLCKMTGVGLNPYLGVFAEGDCLQGRGTMPADGKKELDELSGKVKIPDGHNVHFADGEVYAEVIKLLGDAMPHLMHLPKEMRWSTVGLDELEYWSERLINCVNGSHHLPKGMSDYQYTGTKTRMGYLQKQKECVLYNTPAQIHATLSWKLESPKVRAIKSEDTIAYLNEDFLMKVVEKQWRHREVLLDPGCGGKFFEGKRIHEMPGREYVMLDFSAMDKQHSLQSQVEVVQATCDFLGTPLHMKEWLVESNKNQWLSEGDRTVRLKYSLLSGRRMTTYLNTVLNRVYFCKAMGDLAPKSVYHAGDDIVARFDDEKSASEAIRRAFASVNTFNERKQSYGRGAEFLRVANGDKITMCYLNRSIASTVCGNWVSKLKLAQTDLLSLFNLQAWTLDNRCMMKNYARNLLWYSLARRAEIGFDVAKKICACTISVDGGPVRGGGEDVTIIKPQTEVLFKEHVLKQDGNYAVDDYLGKLMVKEYGGLLKQAEWQHLRKVFKDAAYGKSALDGFKVKGYKYDMKRKSRQVLNYTAELVASKTKGAMTRHPILANLRTRLTQRDAEMLTKVITSKERPNEESWHVWFEGLSGAAVVGDYGQDYNDLSSVGRTAITHALKLSPNVYMDRYVFT